MQDMHRRGAGHECNVGLSIYAYAFYFRLSDYCLRMNDAV